MEVLSWKKIKISAFEKNTIFGMVVNSNKKQLKSQEGFNSNDGDAELSGASCYLHVHDIVIWLLIQNHCVMVSWYCTTTQCVVGGVYNIILSVCRDA
jgi:hypothetical protein